MAGIPGCVGGCGIFFKLIKEGGYLEYSGWKEKKV